MEELDREVAKATYEFYLSESQNAQRQQYELGRWLLASLILVNGGALVLLANTEDKALIQTAAPAFVVGVISALACGLMSWLNAGIREMYYDAYAQPKSLKSGEVQTPEIATRREWLILWTYRLSLVTGLLSAGSFGWGAFAAL